MGHSTNKKGRLPWSNLACRFGHGTRDLQWDMTQGFSIINYTLCNTTIKGKHTIDRLITHNLMNDWEIELEFLDANLTLKSIKCCNFFLHTVAGAQKVLACQNKPLWQITAFTDWATELNWMPHSHPEFKVPLNLINRFARFSCLNQTLSSFQLTRQQGWPDGSVEYSTTGPWENWGWCWPRELLLDNLLLPRC